MFARNVSNNSKANSLDTADFGYGFATAQNPVWTLADVLEATGGALIHTANDPVSFRSVSTDSRDIEPGDLFLALDGERFDGHSFVQNAVKKGAAGVVVSHRPKDSLPIPAVLVQDTLTALGDLAAYRRAHIPELRVFAITGSSGKTTVKEMLATILDGRFTVLKTKGNFNNLVGLPLSLLPLGYHHDFAVLEMGMNRPGEIARLTEIADPDIGCIVNVQEAHLEGLNTIGKVAEAKGELFRGMKMTGVIAVNLDDHRVATLARHCMQKKIPFGRNKNAFVRATHIRNCGEEGMAFTLHIGAQKGRIRIKSLGRHNVINSLAAAAMAYAAGLQFSDITFGLAEFTPYEKRMQIQRMANGIKLINDTYNANPASMLAALETVDGLKQDHRAVAVLGDMLELGGKSASAHTFLGEAVARLGFDYLLAAGNFAKHVIEGARASGMTKEQARQFANKEAISEWLVDSIAQSGIGAGDWILFKGSRGMKMETIIDSVMNKTGSGAV